MAELKMSPHSMGKKGFIFQFNVTSVQKAKLSYSGCKTAEFRTLKS